MRRIFLRTRCFSTGKKPQASNGKKKFNKRKEGGAASKGAVAMTTKEGEDEFDLVNLIAQDFSRIKNYSTIRQDGEPEHLKNDPSWPVMSGTDEFLDLINFPQEEFTPEQQEMVRQEALKQMDITPFEDIRLPEMSVQVPEDHSHFEQLSNMKLSLHKNPYLSLEDKDELMQGLIDEIDAAKADTEPLFLGFEEGDFTSNAQK